MKRIFIEKKEPSADVYQRKTRKPQLKKRFKKLFKQSENLKDLMKAYK
jgi:hypothetical protein